MKIVIHSIVISLVFISSIRCSTNDLERGLGAEIDWLSLDEGLEAAKSENKILMLIIHKSWCGACKAFKPRFAASKEIKELSKNFIMVNVEDDDEPDDPKYGPDGKYIPRILFLEPSNGSVKLDIFNKNGNPSYKYYYSDADSVILSMKVAMIVGNDEKNEL